jgi:hypothetical protein
MKNKELINILSQLQDDSEIIIKYKGKELVIDKISTPVVFKEIYIDLEDVYLIKEELLPINKLAENNKDIDNEFVDIVNDNFFDLI